MDSVWKRLRIHSQTCDLRRETPPFPSRGLFFSVERPPFLLEILQQVRLVEYQLNPLIRQLVPRPDVNSDFACKLLPP